MPNAGSAATAPAAGFPPCRRSRTGCCRCITAAHWNGPWTFCSNPGRARSARTRLRRRLDPVNNSGRRLPLVQRPIRCGHLGRLPRRRCNRRPRPWLGHPSRLRQPGQCHRNRQHRRRLRPNRRPLRLHRCRRSNRQHHRCSNRRLHRRPNRRYRRRRHRNHRPLRPNRRSSRRGRRRSIPRRAPPNRRHQRPVRLERPGGRSVGRAVRNGEPSDKGVRKRPRKRVPTPPLS